MESFFHYVSIKQQNEKVTQHTKSNPVEDFLKQYEQKHNKTSTYNEHFYNSSNRNIHKTSKMEGHATSEVHRVKEFQVTVLIQITEMIMIAMVWGHSMED